MAETKSTTQKLIYFLLGAGVPIAAYLLWNKFCPCGKRKEHEDRLRDIAVEDSFPASDPPSAW